MEDTQPKNNSQKDLKQGIAAFALFNLILVLFAWWGRDPEEPVKWGELRLVFLIEFILLAYILYKLHWVNYALFY